MPGLCSLLADGASATRDPFHDHRQLCCGQDGRGVLRSRLFSYSQLSKDENCNVVVLAEFDSRLGNLRRRGVCGKESLQPFKSVEFSRTAASLEQAIGEERQPKEG